MKIAIGGLLAVMLPLYASAAAAAQGGAQAPALQALSVIDGTGGPASGGLPAFGKGRSIKLVPDFDPSITEYTVELDSDVHGARLSATANEGVRIAIAGEWGVDPYRYGKEGRGRNGDLFPEGTTTIITTPALTGNGDGTFDGHGFYAGPKSVQAWVFATVPGGGTTRYTVTFKLADGRPDYDLFELHMGDGSADGYGPVFRAANGIRLPYALYIPRDIRPDEKLPILMVLHGAGDRARAVDYVNQRQPAATPFARDSESGKNRAIVLVPQMVAGDYSRTGSDWAALGDGKLNPGFSVTPGSSSPQVSWDRRDGNGLDAGPSLGESPFGAAAFELLTRIIAGKAEETSLDDDLSDHVDVHRIYLTGLSMGGAGTIGQMTSHPDVYAAFAPLAAVSLLSRDAAASLKRNDVPVYIGHNADDPTVDVAFAYVNAGRLKEAGYTDDMLRTAIYPPGTYSYESPHSSWYAFYNDPSIRDWIFAQRRAAAPDLPRY